MLRKRSTVCRLSGFDSHYNCCVRHNPPQSCNCATLPCTPHIFIQYLTKSPPLRLSAARVQGGVHQHRAMHRLQLQYLRLS